MTTQKIVWHEGMLLRPQHFQQQDRYYNAQMNLRTQRNALYCWGFFHLELDQQFLSMGKVVVTQASGVLPDGTLFDIGAEREPLVLEIPPNTSNKAVYLALPLVAAGHVETRRPEQEDVIARYISQTVEVSDSNAGDTNSGSLSCALPAFRLTLESEPGQDVFVRLKLCNVLDMTHDGVVTLDPEFVPTFLHTSGSIFLQSCMKEVISMLAHRGDILAERMRGSSRVGAADVGDFMMLQLINRHEPVWRHFYAVDQLHPEQLYRELLSLLGELATYTPESRRPKLEGVRYQHNDQAICFRRLLDSARQALSMVLEQHAVELPLQQRQYGIQVSPLNDRKLLDSGSFILAANAQCDSEELRKRLPSHLKIGPVERIRQLVNLHLPGIKVKPLPVAPRQIPFHAGKTYYALEFTSEELAQLERSGGFAFHVSGDFPGLELSFWAIRN